jgi:type I restriction enzyme M protein
MDSSLAGAALVVWPDHGLIVDPTPPPWTSGMFAGLAGITKAQGKAILDAMRVRDADSPITMTAKGEPEPDADLRDTENVPLPCVPVSWAADPSERLASVDYRTAVADYLATEVLPYVPDAWVDHEKTRLGYEIPLTRHFYRYVPPRPLAEIDAEIKTLEAEIQELLREVAG